MHYGAKCLGKCGKEVSTKTGYCHSCRNTKCKGCGVIFNWINFPKSRCPACTQCKSNEVKKFATSVLGH